ncbi:hypothetical protein MGWOODY_Smn3300 [hydrothermal vent metagenome]|uniref:Uncharacterized protein n=1 Tax=hydrothermal vent metagenome TaxID=652676 RepID=A0A160TH23_9ZZZZ
MTKGLLVPEHAFQSSALIDEMPLAIRAVTAALLTPPN